MKIQKLGKYSSIAIFAVLTVILISGAYYFGYQSGIKNPETFVVKGVANIGDDDLKADFSLFWEAWKKLKDYHIKGEEITEKDFLYGAIQGITSSFDDPNTIFLRADNGDAKKFEEDIAGSFGGIGAEIGIKDGQLIVIAPLKKSPAERAGLQSGDKILKVDEFSTEGANVNDAVKRIRGLIGTSVVLNILRNGWTSPKDFKIVRAEIIAPTLDLTMLEGGIAKVQLHSFNEKASAAFYEAASEIISKNASGMVLDLRNNPGGFLEVAIDIAGWFLERGYVVAIEHFRSGDDRIFRANGNEAFKNFPVVILINSGSASASEILAGALRDHRNIKLIGEKSFGKGTVQELKTLRDGSTLKITVANWLTPNRTVIEKNGLKPDSEVKLTEKDIEAKRDLQLDEAIKVLKAEINK